MWGKLFNIPIPSLSCSNLITLMCMDWCISLGGYCWGIIPPPLLKSIPTCMPCADLVIVAKWLILAGKVAGVSFPVGTNFWMFPKVSVKLLMSSGFIWEIKLLGEMNEEVHIPSLTTGRVRPFCQSAMYNKCLNRILMYIYSSLAVVTYEHCINIFSRMGITTCVRKTKIPLFNDTPMLIQILITPIQASA